MFCLLGVLFLAPVAQSMLNNNEDFDFDDNEKSFIISYIKVWYIIDLFWIGIIALKILSLFSWWFVWGILNFVVYVSTLLLLFLIIYCIYLIFLDRPTSLFIGASKMTNRTIKSWNMFYFVVYLPILNYIYYNKTEITPWNAYWFKESILLTYLLIISGIFTYFEEWFLFTYIFSFLLFVIILRMISLLAWIDFVPEKYKEYLYHTFKKNPDELFAYIIGPIQYLIKNITVIFSWKEVGSTINNYIDSSKKTFSESYTYTQAKSNLILATSYIIVFSILIYLLYQTANLPNIDKYIYIFWFWWILIKYIIDIHYDKVYQIPIFYNIISFSLNLIKKKKK